MDGLIWRTVENSQKKNNFIELFSQNGIQSEVIQSVNAKAAADRKRGNARRMPRKLPI